jgi:hypothetical protein
MWFRRRLTFVQHPQNLVGHFLINQQSFDLDFGAHGLVMDLLHWANMGDLCRNQIAT